MDCFRAIVKKNELSERALELTEFLIVYNSAYFYFLYLLIKYIIFFFFIK